MLFLRKMFHKSATNLLNVSKTLTQDWLNTFDTVLTDCDGVLWRDNIAFPGVPEVINSLISCGKRVFFITNNGTLTRQQLHERATNMGYQIAATDIIAPAHSIAQFLQESGFNQSVYVVGSTAIAQELSNVGIDNFGIGPDVLTDKLSDYISHQVATQDAQKVGAVVVGFDEHFSYGKMMKACNYLGQNKQCLFLTTNIDPVHRYPNYSIPGTGALLRAIETCVEREAVQFGKPNAMVCDTLLRSGAVIAERTLMIGDSCKIDMAFGHNCGFQTLLVGTGHYSASELETILENREPNQHYIPDVFLPSLSDISKFL